MKYYMMQTREEELHPNRPENYHGEYIIAAKDINDAKAQGIAEKASVIEELDSEMSFFLSGMKGNFPYTVTRYPKPDGTYYHLID